jgi:hypothetical protein
MALVVDDDGMRGGRRLVSRLPEGRWAWFRWFRSLVAFVILIWAAFVAVGLIWERVAKDGWPAYDTHAYWLAGRHLLDGSPLYSPSTISTFGAFKYPPLFAQLCIPLALMPSLGIDWLWRATTVLCLRYLIGSWKASLVAFAVVVPALAGPVLQEVSIGNVTFQLAAVVLFSTRDRRGAYLLPWVAALKFGPGLLLPYLWWRRPEWRGAIVRGMGLFVAACAISFAVAPSLWIDYLGTFGWESESVMSGWGVLAVFPGHGGLDFAVRLVIAALAIGVALRYRADWLAYVAGTLTCPILVTSRLAPLVALWPLALRKRTGSKTEGDRPEDASPVGTRATAAQVSLPEVSEMRFAIQARRGRNNV